MKKRLQAILAACMVVFLFIVDCTPMAGAVAPLVLVEAALASYVASTGYKLYVDNGTGDDLLGLVSDLYGTYLETHPEAYTLLALAQGNFVYNDNSGNIIVTQTAADTFQNFSDWIKSNYNVSPGASSNTSVISPGPGYYTNQYGSFLLVSPGQTYSFTASTVSNPNFYIIRVTSSSVNSPIYLFFYGENNVSTSSGIFTLISLSSFSYSVTQVNTSGSSHTYNRSSERDSTNNNYSGVYQGYNVYSPVPTVSSRYGSLPNYMFSNLTQDSSVGLAVGLAQDVIDKAGDIVTGKSLVLDVGAAAGDTAEEIASTVVAGYDAVTGTIPVTDSIVATEVIDTPVQAYPDFNDLGLPELGLALVERFPFCIPYDFVHLISLFNADPVAPYIEIDLFPQSFRQRIGLQPGQAVFTLDMTAEQYATLGLVMRWGSLVGFCVGLMFLTKRLIWTS